jgi:hypothetical protein
MHLQAWEGRAYEYGMNNLRSMGYPVEGLKFDPELVCYSCVACPHFVQKAPLLIDFFLWVGPIM